MSGSYVQQTKDGMLNWLESVRYSDEGWGRWKYNLHQYRAYGLQSSAIAINLLTQLGELDNVPAEKKREAAEFFASCQDPADGYFKDPLVTDADRQGTAHSWEHIWNQMSGGPGSLVMQFGGTLRAPLPKKSFADLSAVDPTEWTLSLAWENPWMVAEEWATAINVFYRNLPEDEKSTEHPMILAAFDAYEQNILDAETGMPILKGCTNPSVGMAGLFKAMSAYLNMKRPIPYAEKAIDFTLALQQPSGEFGYGNDMCINWDSLWVIDRLDVQLEGTYRPDDITAAGNGMAKRLLAHYGKPDGGFAFNGDHCLTAHNSIRTSDPLPEGDMLGTTMSMRCLSYADAWNERHEK